jgi:undecaprenyl diphosphate synthase
MFDVVQWLSEFEEIEYVSFWSLSTDNLKRDEEELNLLFSLFEEALLKGMEEKKEEFKVRVRFLGDLGRLPRRLVELMRKAEQRFNSGDRTVVFFMAYGGRDEILHAVNALMRAGVSRVDAELFTSYLYTADIPDPDFLIRTSGEMRLSGFLPWQTSYTELYFIKTLWPDLSREEVIGAVKEFYKRKRRFGR